MPWVCRKRVPREVLFLIVPDWIFKIGNVIVGFGHLEVTVFFLLFFTQ